MQQKRNSFFLCFRFQIVLFIFVSLLLLQYSTSLQSIKSASTITNLQITTIPPLLDSPVFSLATLNDDENDSARTNMNIITYACPVSFSPDRIWAIGLYKPTLSYTNFLRTRTGTLQLLTKQHSPLVPILGGISGRNYTKQTLCTQYGFPWIEHPSTSTGKSDTIQNNPMILPGCSYYIRFECIEIIDAGGHDVAICKVRSMESNGEVDNDTTTPYLTTSLLREQGIISNQGRVTDEAKASLLNSISSS